MSGGFGAVDERFFVDDRGVEGRDEFGEIGLAFEEVGKEIGILDGQGADLVEEGLLGLQLLAERKTRVAVHEYIQAARGRRAESPARRDEHGDRRGGAPRRTLEIQSGVPGIYRRARRPAFLLVGVLMNLAC